jgi:hypothetical protein
MAPDTDLVGPQPPLPAGSMLASLVQVDRDMLPGIEFTLGPPTSRLTSWWRWATRRPPSRRAATSGSTPNPGRK